MTTEHRSRPRTNLHASLFLLPGGGGPLLETQTENVSMNGFFCFIDRLFPPGERFRFLLQLSPSPNESHSGRAVYLEGVAEVVHVKVGSVNKQFGIGCRVESYRVMPQTEFHSQDEICNLLNEPFRAGTTDTGTNRIFPPLFRNVILA